MKNRFSAPSMPKRAGCPSTGPVVQGSKVTGGQEPVPGEGYPVLGRHAYKVNLLDFDKAHLREYFTQLGEKSFHADQIIQWIHQYGMTDCNRMTNLGKKLRQFLAEHAVIELPKIERKEVSQDGTAKWLMQLADGNCVETVMIPEGDRRTLCVSTQTGCAMQCPFCATGQQGPGRNLAVSEIIGQLWRVMRDIDGKITNVVIMGMGEPLLNLENTVQATNLMMDDLAYGLSKYRVTISTVGVVPAMDALSKMTSSSLAVSLHAPNDTLRNALVPINKKYPLSELIPACKRFFGPGSRRKVAFEYIMIKDLNDKPTHAKQLVKLLQGVPCKVNLIPCNPAPGIAFQCSSESTIIAFQKILIKAGITTIVRKTRGADIAAACGQLKAQ